MSRRTLLKGATALAAPMSFVRNGWAQGRQIQVGIWGGTQGEFIRKSVLPAFENEFGCKVLAEQGATLGQIAKLRATKEAPKYTVMFVDDLGVEIAKREGLIDPLPKDSMPSMVRSSRPRRRLPASAAPSASRARTNDASVILPCA